MGERTVYASRTKVPADKTRMDIERLVKKYGAKGFAAGWHLEGKR